MNLNMFFGLGVSNIENMHTHTRIIYIYRERERSFFFPLFKHTPTITK